MTALDFDKISTLLISQDVITSPSELHGIICGQLCAAAERFDTGLTWSLLGNTEQAGKIVEELMVRLGAGINEEMQVGDYHFQPLLPADDEELSVRLYALGRWCEGFNLGFGAGYQKGQRTILAETSEVLTDFASIAEIEEQTEENEQSEKDFMELVEYARMAATTVYLQNNSGPGLTAENSGELH